MTDAVDRAVDAQIDAYRPDTTPPFEAIEARKRRRDRRRLAAAGAVVPAVVAVAVLAVVPQLDGGLSERLTPGAGVAAQGTTFAVRPLSVQADAYEQALDQCLRLPGVDGGPVADHRPAPYSLWAAGDPVEPLRDCVGGVEGVDVAMVVGRPGDELGRAELLERCVEGTEVEDRWVGMTEQQVRDADPVRPVRVICKDRVFLDRTSDSHADRLNLVIEQGRVIWAGRF
jgi:hypothetical protein